MFFKQDGTDEVLRELPKPMFFKLEFLFDYLASRYTTKQVSVKLLERSLHEDNRIIVEIDMRISSDYSRINMILEMDCEYSFRILECRAIDWGNSMFICPMDNPRSNCPDTVLSVYRLFSIIEKLRDDGWTLLRQYQQKYDDFSLRFYLGE